MHVISTYQHTPAVCMRALLLLISTHRLCACVLLLLVSTHRLCACVCYYYLSAHTGCVHARVISTYQHTPAVCMRALLLLISTHRLCACVLLLLVSTHRLCACVRYYYLSAHTGCVHARVISTYQHTPAVCMRALLLLISTHRLCACACYYYLSAWWKQVPVGCTAGVVLGTRQAGMHALASYKGNETAFEQNSFLLSLLMIWFPFPLMFSQGEHTSLVHKTRTNWWEDKTWLAETNKTLQCPFKLASWMGSGQNHSMCCSFFVVVFGLFGGGGGPDAKKTMTTTTKLGRLTYTTHSQFFDYINFN